MTLDELDAALAERDLSMQVWPAMPGWCVWLFCSDDPELGIFPGTGDSIEQAVKAALAQWDGKHPEARN